MSPVHANTFEAAMALVREHVARNPIDPAKLPEFIAQVHASVLKIAQDSMQAAAPVAAVHGPAVPVETSVTRDHIICLEDGSKHKMMKRYLMRKFSLTPDDYRARWGLSSDYPMTAPGYSEVKRLEAEAVGLGTAANKGGVNLARAVEMA